MYIVTLESKIMKQFTKRKAKILDANYNKDD